MVIMVTSLGGCDHKGIAPFQQHLICNCLLSETIGIEPWVIGVIVVGLLGLVATIFCVMGMYLACRTDKTDQGKGHTTVGQDTVI